MAQHDYDLANQSGASFRADLNNCLDAIVSLNQGSSEPGTSYTNFAYMPWLDTSLSPARIKIRNSGNSAWTELGEYVRGADIPYDNATSALAATDVDAAIDEAVGLIARKNLLINGDGRIWQRGTSFSPTPGAAAIYIADRWMAYCEGASVTYTPYTTAPNRGIKIAGAASNTQCRVFQRIESQNCDFLSGSAVTFSADIYTTGARTLTWQIRTADVIDDFSSDTNKHGSTVALSAGWNYGVTFTVATVDTTVTRGMTLRLSFGANTGDDIVLLNAQLEAGSVPTSFERLSVGVTKDLCNRYYQKLASPRFIGRATSTTAVSGGSLVYPTTMRDDPTATVNGGGLGGGSGTPTVTATPDAAYFDITGGSSFTFGDAVYYYGTSIELDAEL